MVNYTSGFQSVSASQVFFGPGFGVLDGDIVVDGGTTYLYCENLADGNLYGAQSTTGAPNSFTTYTSGLRQGNAIEGPAAGQGQPGQRLVAVGATRSAPVNGEF